VSQSRLVTACAVVVLTVCLVVLGAWSLLWRLMLNQQPYWLYVMPINIIALQLAAGGLLLAHFAAARWIVRSAAGLLIFLALFIFLERALSLRNGLEQYLFAERTQSLLRGDHPGRPAFHTALCMLFVGLGLWFAHLRSARWNPTDVNAIAVLFLSFTILISHFYQTQPAPPDAIAAAANSMSPMESILLVTMAIGLLSLNRNGIVAALYESGAGAETKRRLLPAVVFVPVALGLVESLLVRWQLLDPSTAQGLTVTSIIVVFLALMEWVGGLVARRTEEQSGLLRKHAEQAREEGMTDALTGLLNRRGWETRVKAEEAQSRRTGANACVIVIDLDGLKKINDTQGHAMGDAFIKKAAFALKSAARTEDVLARLGGDEFAYLAVGCNPEHAGVVLKRLSQSLQAQQVQASLGWAMRDLAGSLANAFQEADQSMYAHKRARKAESRAVSA